MQYGKLLGWGIVIYAVMYLLVAALSIYQMGPFFSRVIALGAIIMLALFAGLSLRRHALWDIVPYSFVWMVQVILLDALMSVPFAGWQLYFDWNVWVGYGMVLIVPLFSVYLMRQPGGVRTP